MSAIAQTPKSEVRVQFLDYLFFNMKGYLCIATASRSKADFRQRFFEWPAQRAIVSNFLEEEEKKRNLWFCVNLLSQPERKKEYCLPSTFAWADLDYIVPTNKTQPFPTCVIESSPARFQAYWRIAGEAVPPDVAEDFSRKLAYSIGADKSGWDLTQLLRVPWTNNFKYDPPVQTKLISITNASHPIEVFDAIQLNIAESGPSDDNMPLPTNLPTFDNVIYRYKSEGRLDDDFMRLLNTTPEGGSDWSKIMWRFINKCLELGMTREEVYVVADQAGCNKYKRDNRPRSYLWRDVVKAAQEQGRFEILLGGKVEIVKMPALVDFDEFEEDTFIKDYKNWALQATDAPEQYHELSCFIALSAILSPGLFLPVDWGDVVPNIWGLILGESGTTRKTTSMRMAIDMLKEIDEGLILATDGSAEGILSGLSRRPQRTSIFWKDEVSALFDSMNRKDYLAGLTETFAQLYDVPKILTRMLRKEVITISDPYFIFFGGGIKDRVYSLINEEYILSGFMPRFLIVTGETDLAKMRKTGPRSITTTENRDKVVQSLCNFRERFNVSREMIIGGQAIKLPGRIEAYLTDEAWAFSSEVEHKLTIAGHETDMSMLAAPTFTRLYFSLLKMSLLIAASRREPDPSNRLLVELQDVKQAAFYIERWGHSSIDLIVNAGRTSTEKVIDRALALVKRKEGLAKSEFMQRLHLSARESKDLIDTMVQRGLIDVKQSGRGVRLYSN